MPSADSSYKGFRYPKEIISHAVWLYPRFALSLRDVQELMFERGVVVSHETIRQWCAKFGQSYANQLRRRRPRPGDKWHPDEVFIPINGERMYLWRAVDQDGVVLDILVQSRRNTKAAKQFFRKLLKGLRYVPRVLVTDKPASYQVAHREMLASVEHRRSKYRQQSGRELASADSATGAPDEAVRLTRTDATVPVRVLRHHGALPAAAAHVVGIRLASRDDGPLRGVARNHRGRHRCPNNAPSQ